MPFILLAIVAVAAIVVSGMSAVHGPTVVTGTAEIIPAANWSMPAWMLIIAVIGLCAWWLLRRRRS